MRGKSVTAESVSVDFRRGNAALSVLESIDLAVQPGEFLSIIGPSGCGKSTFLNVISGQTPYNGKVFVGDDLVRGRPEPGLGYLPQRDHFLPWRTIIDNVAMPLQFRGIRRKDRHERALQALERVGLRDFAKYLPSQLSGGMMKRAALAQVITLQPQLLLMDEAFGALDAQTRTLLQDEFYALWRDDRRTVIWVTHDLTEAVCLAQRVVVMSSRPGRILQEFTVNLPIDRSVTDIRFTDEARELEREIWEVLRDEVQLVSKPRIPVPAS